MEEYTKEHFPTANIIVAGITGTGKSTLINAVFGSKLAETGKGCPKTQHIQEYHNENIPICVWDTMGLELDQKTTRKSIDEILSVIEERAESEDPYNRIHAIWYCVSSNSNRYQGVELDFIKKLHSIGVPFIIALTQSYGDEDGENEFEAQIQKENEERGMHDITIIQVLAEDYKLRGQPPVPAFGLDKLIQTTVEQMPRYLKNSVIAAQRVSRDRKRVQSEKIIAEYVQKARKGFWDKVPFANIAAANSKVVNMLQEIGAMYNVTLTERAVEKVADECKIDFANVFGGLVTPFYKKYYNKVISKLAEEKINGFKVELGELDKSDRVAVMVAFYGYTFIEALEEIWDDIKNDKLKDVEEVYEAFLDRVNEILKKRNNS